MQEPTFRIENRSGLNANGKRQMNDQRPSRRRWLQIRLSTILLLMAIVALGMAQFAATRRVVELEARNRELTATNSKLRAEAGYLEVDDPSKAIVLRLCEFDELTWRWKVWLPQGKWSISSLTQGIPSQGVPNGPSAGSKDGGREVLVSATVRKGADGQWQSRASIETLQIGNDLKESHRLIAQVTGSGSMIAQSIDIAGDKAQISFDPERPVVLIRLRAHETVPKQMGGWQQSKDNPQSSEGIMVWLHRTP